MLLKCLAKREQASHRQLGKQRKLALVLGCIFFHKENSISRPLRANLILDGRIVAYWL